MLKQISERLLELMFATSQYYPQPSSEAAARANFYNPRSLKLG